MIRINLIPHREAFRQQQIIEYILVFVASLVLTLVLIFAVDVYSTKDLTVLQEEYSTLQSRNTQLSKKIGELRNLDGLRKEVVDKLAIVDELQAGRFRSLSTFQAISTAIPSNIWLTNIKDSGGSIVVDGWGESSKAVANFMRSLLDTDVFDDVKLSVDQEASSEGVTVRKFQLSFRQLSLAEQAAKAKKKLEIGGKQ